MSSLPAAPSLPEDRFPTSAPGSRPLPRRNGTIVTLVTATVTPTFIITSPIISTETTIKYTTIPGPDPAATAAIASASAILANGSTQYDTKFIIIVAITGSTFLLVLLALICLIYIRHQRGRRKVNPTDTPPFTSLNAPRTPSFFAPIPLTAPQIPPQTYATSLSMGPTRNVSTQALATSPQPRNPSTNRPPTRPRRSISEPMSVPDYLRRDLIMPMAQTPRTSTAQLQQTPTPIRESNVPEIPVMPTTLSANLPSPTRRVEDGSPSPSRAFPLTGTSSDNVPSPTSAPPRTPRFREGFPAHLMGERAGIEAERRRKVREERAAASTSDNGGGIRVLVPFTSSGPNTGLEEGGSNTGLAVTRTENIEMQGPYGNGRGFHSPEESAGLASTRASSGIFPE